MKRQFELVLACWLLSFALAAQPTGQRLQAYHAESGRALVFEERQPIYYSLALAPGSWQRGFILEIHHEYMVIAEGHRRGFARKYSIAELSALKPRPMVFMVLRGLSASAALGSAAVMGQAFREYQQGPNTTNFSLMVLGACGTIMFTIPTLIPPRYQPARGWAFAVLDK